MDAEISFDEPDPVREVKLVQPNQPLEPVQLTSELSIAPDRLDISIPPNQLFPVDILWLSAILDIVDDRVLIEIYHKYKTGFVNLDTTPYEMKVELLQIDPMILHKLVYPYINCRIIEFITNRIKSQEIPDIECVIRSIKRPLIKKLENGFIVIKYCSFPTCLSYATCITPDMRIFCVMHGLIYVNVAKTYLSCHVENCNIQATFAYRKCPQMSCEHHKIEADLPIPIDNIQCHCGEKATISKLPCYYNSLCLKHIEKSSYPCNIYCLHPICGETALFGRNSQPLFCHQHVTLGQPPGYIKCCMCVEYGCFQKDNRYYCRDHLI